MGKRKKLKSLPKELIKPEKTDTFFTTQMVEFMCRENDHATTCRVNYGMNEENDILF
ncbi:hypothetical protein [Flagellimonas meridianipacifica]|uniref:Uncharacterized protein n=1 Tax=Flagellimonas meridianipacifica TaxID=1080225 RepID=A0A2T0MFP3_9FLAO|nr:hypothetical protein [Allomuricauda pacifica]PRX56382.1 hypothetical protein CLV81_0379 [Allomuricauda pacifica]